MGWLIVAGTVAVVAGGPAAIWGRLSHALADPTPPADPWATLRGCGKVLEKFVRCGSDRSFQAYRSRWVAATPAGMKAPAKEIARRLKSWDKAGGRRAQCAIWARRLGAPEHIGEGSPLERLAAAGGDVSCEHFARKLDEDGWVPAALVDARRD